MKIKNSLLVTTLAAFFAGGVATAGDKDIVDTAVAAGSFKTLAAALEAGGLIEALKEEGPFTVFAPTDDAFAALPEGTVETLLKPENKDKLVDILTYHVVSGAVPAETAVTLSAATALNKKEIKLSLKDGALFLNDSKVVKTDITTSNGVIHVIDAVLLPPSDGIQTSAVTR
ncbi:MAG: fasciclin domain-containing protein [Verrucomicrobiales bacterium]